MAKNVSSLAAEYGPIGLPTSLKEIMHVQLRLNVVSGGT